MANTLRVNQLSFETVAPTESLSGTLPELEAFEVNDLLMTTQAITAVRPNCEELKSTAVCTEWLPHTGPTPPLQSHYVIVLSLQCCILAAVETGEP